MERSFYELLQSIFLGERMKGSSGFINLMAMKSRYYTEVVFPYLKNEIVQILREFPDFKEELYEKLYTFFRRYFSPTGSLYFHKTLPNLSIYDRIYTDDRDVILFWKTHMLYYVKSDFVYRNLEVKVGDAIFYFDVSVLSHKMYSEKRRLYYDPVKKEGQRFIVHVSAEGGSKNPVADLSKKFNLPESVVSRALLIFERQAEVDYFIAKNLGVFLREQFDLWMYEYIFSGMDHWSKSRIKQLSSLRRIASKLIDYIAEFENELVKIWNKPKFVLNSHYVISLDRIKDLKPFLSHKGFIKQVEEWKNFGFLTEEFNIQDLFDANGSLSPSFQYLPLDTKYFPDLKGKLERQGLSLDGWLIKSENYQALKTLLPRFVGRVQSIYIDPPFNLEKSSDFIYKVNYKDSTWLTMLENRIRLARDLLANSGFIFVRCDHNGNMLVRLLLDEIFGRDNFRNELILKRAGTPQRILDNRFEHETNSLFLYSKDSDSRIKPLTQEKQRKLKWQEMSLHKENKNKHTVTINGETFYAPRGRHFPSQSYVDGLVKEGRIRIKKKEYVDVFGKTRSRIPEYLENPYEVIKSDWTDIASFVQSSRITGENTEAVVKRSILATSDPGDIVMDFFLGSGTTVAVAHKLGRKWIGVEMGEHFWSVVLPRMKKVLFYDKSGISKDSDVREHYNHKSAGGFFKYYELEQYEQTLKKCIYSDDEPLYFDDGDFRYVFLKDKKLIDGLSIQGNKVNIVIDNLFKDIDLPETLSNLMGIDLLSIDLPYVYFANGTKLDLDNLDWKLLKPLIWW